MKYLVAVYVGGKVKKQIMTKGQIEKFGKVTTTRVDVISLLIKK